MYPRDYFQLAPPFPRSLTVFVVMDFGTAFNPRWEHVISPAISVVKHGPVPESAQSLIPHRANLPTSGESIPVDIFKGISESILVLADISTLGFIGSRAIRNPNVLYEVGLAHAVRLPEEVLLFRSDSDPLPFDVAHVRVHDYNPDGDSARAVEIVSDKIVSTLQSIDVARSHVVARIVDSLDAKAFEVLIMGAKEGIKHPRMSTMGEALSHAATLSAIQRLLELGVVQSEMPKLTEKVFSEEKHFAERWNYRLTTLGVAVVRAAATTWATSTPEQVVKKLLQEVDQAEGEARLPEGQRVSHSFDMPACCPRDFALFKEFVCPHAGARVSSSPKSAPRSP